MKSLVTGATGFIGEHLVKALSAQGGEVRCLVRKGGKGERLSKKEIELYYGDLLDRDSLIEAVKGIKIVYHLAGEVYSPKDKDYSINIIGTKNLLEACLAEKIEKFVYLSSIAVVGPNPERNVRENETILCNPISPYGRSKYEAEKLVIETFKIHKLPVIIIRAPIVYGPGVSRSSRVFMFLQLINKGLYRTIGDGNNLISLCYIDNLIQGIMQAGGNNTVGGATYCIADERSYSMNEIAQVIAKEVGVQLPSSHMPIWLAIILAACSAVPAKLFGFIPPLSFDKIKEVKSNWVCDISMAKENLGYKPIIRFEEGIKKTVEWYMEKQ
jgi:nucleoside-diphosphate-sugar epimerase